MVFYEYQVIWVAKFRRQMADLGPDGANICPILLAMSIFKFENRPKRANSVGIRPAMFLVFYESQAIRVTTFRPQMADLGQNLTYFTGDQRVLSVFWAQKLTLAGPNRPFEGGIWPSIQPDTNTTPVPTPRNTAGPVPTIWPA